MNSNKTNFVIISLFILFITSCQSSSAIKTFDNKWLHWSQYAKLYSPTGVLVLEIDGKEMDYSTEYHILPGEHKLHVMVSAFKGEKAYKVGDVDISFLATAEHVYHIKSIVTMVQQHKDYTKKTNDFLWIEDKTMDSIVAGTKP